MTTDESASPLAFPISHVREQTRMQHYTCKCVRKRPDTDASF